MTITNPSLGSLDAEQLAEFERTLQVMLEERVPPASGDASGVARHRAQTESLEAALTRIGQGTFGCCRWCGEAIPVQRLEVVPTALDCVACTEGRR